MAEKVMCVNSVDYSQVEGERILPFRFTLNLEESVLYPGAGQKQKFCYEVEGVGQDTSRYADLSHFLFGICETITKEDIAEITVVVDGVPQKVVWGDNVEIKTVDKPDNPTGCSGLKFDFPLNKVDGIMQVCISLNKVYAVGGMNVCVFGGNTTATGLMICGPACGGEMPCDSTFFQIETVCVPVTVTPFATPGVAKANCCGKPIINPDNQCTGSKKSCSFTIKQRLCIEIPLTFGAVIETGSAVVQCGDVSEVECDCSTVTDIGEVPESVELEEELRKSRRYFNR